jgi:hypothetical protein
VKANMNANHLSLEGEDEVLSSFERRRAYKRLYQHRYRCCQPELRVVENDIVVVKGATFIGHLTTTTPLYVGDNPRQMQQHNTIVAITLSMLIVDF